MRRKALLAGLALLGLCPGVALAQQSYYSGSGGYRVEGSSDDVSASSDSSSQWISLKDDTDVSTAKSAGSVAASQGACSACAGVGCDQCGSCCDPCGGMGGLRRWNDPCMRGIWVNVDYLLWSVGGYNLPPLVTTAPNGVVPDLGNPLTTVAFGNNEVDDDLRSGGRIRGGVWLDNNETIGVEGHFFGFEEVHSHTDFDAAGNGAVSLGRPYVEVAPNFPIPGVGPGEAVLLAAFDDPVFGVVSNGHVDVDTSSNVYSLGGSMRGLLAEDNGIRVDALGGLRFLRFDEGLFVQSISVAGPGAPFPIPIGFVRRVADTFNTENLFYGGEFGVNIERDFGDMFSIEIIPTLAIGEVYQRVDLAGYKTFEFPGFAPDVRNGGLLVQPSNAGTGLARAQFEREQIGFLPQICINAGIQLTRQVRFTAGWTALYLSDVVRPGDQIDRAVNGNQLVDQPIVGPVRPLFNFNSTDVWMYGANFGIESTF